MNMDVKNTDTGSKWEIHTEEQPSGSSLQRRRYIRLDITSPIEMKLLVPTSENNDDTAGFIPSRGEILNVSGGGVLVESIDALPEGDLVVMEIEFNETEKISGIVGRVKRCDSDSESRYLIGVEFCTQEDIEENCPPDCRKLLGDSCASFDEKVRSMINKYVFNKKVREQSKKD